MAAVETNTLRRQRSWLTCADRRVEGATEEENVAVLLPSKVSVKFRHLLHHTSAKPLYWALILLVGLLAVPQIFAQSDTLDQDEGICPIKCACLDSYIQCTKLNLITAPSRVPKWAEFL